MIKIADSESYGAIIGLGVILGAAIVLELLNHLSGNMVSVLQWAGGAFMGAQAAAHIGEGIKR